MPISTNLLVGNSFKKALYLKIKHTGTNIQSTPRIFATGKSYLLLTHELVADLFTYSNISSERLGCCDIFRFNVNFQAFVHVIFLFANIFLSPAFCMISGSINFHANYIYPLFFRSLRISVPWFLIISFLLQFYISGIASRFFFCSLSYFFLWA